MNSLQCLAGPFSKSLTSTKPTGNGFNIDGITTTVAPGERVALVGRNGSGKSTLFRLILGQEHIDKREIAIPRDYRIEQLAQHLNFTQPLILDEVCLGLDHDHQDERYRILRGHNHQKTLL